MRSSADRVHAARNLIRIEDGAYASRLLASRSDPGVRVRVLGVLRWLRALDSVLAAYCSRPIEVLDPAVRAGLRIGLFEACVLDVPAAVATDAAVHLVRRLGHRSACGMVNAVMRRASTGWSSLMNRAEPDLRLSHPAWLHRRWVDRYGAQAAGEVMAANQQPAPVWVRFFSGSGRAAVEEQGLGLQPHPWCPDAWCAPGSNDRLLAAVRCGDAYVQDPSSQLVGVVAAGLAAGGGRFVDLCAAPGGKAAVIASLAGWTLGVAVDIRPGRVRLMCPLLERFRSCSAIVADSTAPPLAGRLFDLVLLDAPCTGTGTLRRHPELRWRLRPESIGELAAVQKRLLKPAIDLVAPGGVLVYSTCSMEPEENEDHFDRPTDGLEAVDLGPELPDGVPAIPTHARGVTILTHEHGDGFTIHAFRRAR